MNEQSTKHEARSSRVEPSFSQFSLTRRVSCVIERRFKMQHFITLFLFLFLINSSRVDATQPTLRRKVLSACVNTAPHDGVDQGCDDDVTLPICLLASGKEPAANVAGEKCGTCINTVNSNAFADLGCSAEFPLCDAPFGTGGTACVAATEPKCTNSAAYGGVDAGCSRDTPLCTNSKTGKEVGANVAGDVCGACLKVYTRLHYRFGFADYGCGLNYPRCMTATNSDPARRKAGAQCCTAAGNCERPSACPCNLPDSIWNKVVVAGINPWNSNDLTCLADATSASLFVTGTPSGIGTSALEFSESWVCSDQPRVSRTISEAEGKACLAEVQAATKAMGLSECL